MRLEVDAAHRAYAAVVADRDVLERHVSISSGQGSGIRLLRDRRLRVENVIQPLAG